MKAEDINRLDALERRALNTSFQPEQVRRRIRNIVVWGLVVLGVVVVVATWKSLLILTAVFIGYLIATVLEKISYAQTILDFEALVRKLVHRIEQLENVPLTPDHTEAVSVRPGRDPNRVQGNGGPLVESPQK